MKLKSALIALMIIGSTVHVSKTKPFFCELVAALVIYRLFVDEVRVHSCHCQRDIAEFRRWAYEHEKRFKDMNKRVEQLIKKLQTDQSYLLGS